MGCGPPRPPGAPGPRVPAPRGGRVAGAGGHRPPGSASLATAPPRAPALSRRELRHSCLLPRWEPRHDVGSPGCPSLSTPPPGAPVPEKGPSHGPASRWEEAVGMAAVASGAALGDLGLEPRVPASSWVQPRGAASCPRGAQALEPRKAGRGGHGEGPGGLCPGGRGGQSEVCSGVPPEGRTGSQAREPEP